MFTPTNWQDFFNYIGASIIFMIYAVACLRASDKVANTLADSVIAISFFPTAYFFISVWQAFFIRFLGPAFA